MLLNVATGKPKSDMGLNSIPIEQCYSKKWGLLVYKDLESETTTRLKILIWLEFCLIPAACFV